MKKNFTNNCATLICLISAFFITNQINAQQIDPGFLPVIAGYPVVTATAFQSDGKILVAGSIAYVGNHFVNGLARLNSDGTLDTTFNPPVIDMNVNFVSSIVYESSGKILIGGQIQGSKSLMRLNADGGLDANFNIDQSITNVITVAPQNDGKYIVLSSSVKNVARINNDGSMDNSFNAGTGMNSYGVGSTDVALQSDGKIVVAGTFNQFNGASANCIVRLNSDGSMDNTFSIGLGPKDAYPRIQSIKIQPDGKLLFAGSFSGFDNSNAQNIVRLNVDGSVDNSFVVPGPSANIFTSDLFTLELIGDDILMAGMTIGNSPIGYKIIRLNPDGSLNSNYSSQFLNLPINGYNLDTQLSLSVQGNSILVGGAIYVGNNDKLGLALFDGSGNLESFDAHLGGKSSVSSIVQQPDGKVLIGGDFVRIGSTPANDFARLNMDGTIDAGFQQNIGINDYSVNAIELQFDGKILVGGDFNKFNGVNRPGIVRLNSDGTIDNSFNASIQYLYLGFGVNVVHSLNSGKIIVAGAFNGVNSTSIKNIVRLNSDGSIDNTFNTSLLVSDQYISSIGIQSSGSYIIGGTNSAFQGFLFRIDPDGNKDNLFNPALDFSNKGVETIKVLPNDNIVVGGFLTSGYSDTTPNPILQISADGKIVDGLSVAVAGGAVLDVGTWSNGDLLLGGAFKSINFVPSQGLARVTPAGSVPNFNYAMKGSVYKILQEKTGRNTFYLAGDFTSINGIKTSGFCKINGDAPMSPKNLLATIDPVKPSINLNWSGTPSNGNGFEIWRSEDSGNNFLVIDSVTQNTFSYVDGKVVTSANYIYKVRAYETEFFSDFSNTVQVTIPAAPVAEAPTLVTPAGFVANWTSVSGAIGYQLDVSTDNFTTFVLGYNSSIEANTSKIVTGLIAGTQYQYRVRATNSSGNSANSNVIALTTPKSDQAITFASLPDVTLGDPPITLSATASSNLTVNYTSSSSRVTLSGNVITIVGAGRDTITATQPGNTSYNSATAVKQSFCIKPAKPTVTLSGDNTATPTLTSSAASGNQWFLNGIAITGSTNSTLSVSVAGVYTVQITTSDGCASAVSTDFPIIVTGDIPSSELVRLYPNPSRDHIFVTGIKGEIAESSVVDMVGKYTSMKLERQGDLLKADIGNLAGGMYTLRITEGTQVHQIKFIKQ